uniref:Uncharacterized protein n=1 Tax=Lutzomyia longipalpis TaxID=7200 RepID=A0A7G3B0U4_LUTLO
MFWLKSDSMQKKSIKSARLWLDFILKCIISPLLLLIFKFFRAGRHFDIHTASSLHNFFSTLVNLSVSCEHLFVLGSFRACFERFRHTPTFSKVGKKLRKKLGRNAAFQIRIHPLP